MSKTILDETEDMSVSLSEWIIATLDRDILLSQEKLNQAFSYFDREGSGRITALAIKKQYGTATLKDSK